MAVDSPEFTSSKEESFDLGHVAPIVAGHFINDTYTAFVAPLLPTLIEKLSLSLTQAGSFSAILQVPALLNPLIGYLADKFSLRYFVIFAPAVTATLISSIGFADSYWAVAALLFLTGISVAAYHAPAPAMIARVAGNKVGLGMSLFMAAGELARTLGPILAVWGISLWTLDGFFRMMVPAWLVTIYLFWRLRNIEANPARGASLKPVVPALRTLFLPILIITFFRNFLVDSLVTYLPTYMNFQGASLWIAGSALAVLQLAGVGGALISGPASDRFGRKISLLAATIAPALFMLWFLRAEGWAIVLALVLMGFTALSTGPIMLALVQDQLPNNRAVGNGLFMMISFAVRTVSILAIGYMGDRFGLNQAFFWSALISLFAIPAIFMLPGPLRKPAS